jgi:hypothetical protein
VVNPSVAQPPGTYISACNKKKITAVRISRGGSGMGAGRQQGGGKGNVRALASVHLCCLAGNVNILDVFKRLILKTCLCVIPTCQPNTADMSPTLQLLMVFFHVICRVVLLIVDMLAMQQPASAGEAQQKRQQCNERGVGSDDATQNNETTALGGGGGDGQR